MYSANEDYLLQVLRDADIVTDSKINDARSKRQGVESLVEALIRLEMVSQVEVSRALAIDSGMEFIDLLHYEPLEEILALVEPVKANQFKVIPLSLEENRLQVAVADPSDLDKLDSLPHVLGYDVDPVCATPEQIHEGLIKYYGSSGEIDDTALEVLTAGGGGGSTAEGEGGDDAPIIKLAAQILTEAMRTGASDIHIEPLEASVRIRYRIDGTLHEIANHPKRLLSSIIARMKIMSGTISIAEKRLPQDGRIQLRLGKKDVDLRVSTIPTNHGESIVMRILDKSALSLGLPQLGFLSDDQATFEQLITLPDGILLVTGPTGSGKTTTLYACLNHINKPDKKIITVEDPVEYQMSGINQVPVKEDIGMTFAAALRAILRQAPNIVMIGEIRDLETASIAINASLTGHLVFSTLHTNDAPSAVARLADIGVKPFLISSAVRAIIAQRLVRKLHGDCKVPYVLTPKEMSALGVTPEQAADATISGAGGCPACRGTGHKGRAGIFEIFKIDDQIRHMVNENLSTPKLRRQARELGMRTMREDGIRKVLAGMTTAKEVLHVTMGDAE
ncbi:MAG: type IV pilus assembly protein PilB [Pseudoalteromonas tetraodonis]